MARWIWLAFGLWIMFGDGTLNHYERVKWFLPDPYIITIYWEQSGSVQWDNYRTENIKGFWWDKCSDADGKVVIPGRWLEGISGR